MNVDPNDNLGYWLFYTQRSVAYAFAEVLKQCCLEQQKPYIITPPQWGVLALLAESDGLTVGIISQKRRVDAPTITGIINRLEQHRLVERRHNREDRRVVRVYLTEESKHMLQLLMTSVEAFNETLTQGFSKDEQRDLLLKLKSIVANVSTVVPATCERFGLSPEDFVDEPARAPEGNNS